MLKKTLGGAGRHGDGRVGWLGGRDDGAGERGDYGRRGFGGCGVFDSRPARGTRRLSTYTVKTEEIWHFVQVAVRPWKGAIARSAARRWILPRLRQSRRSLRCRRAGLPENTAAALCYLLGLITGILFLVLEPYNKNKLIRFHAFQSIFLHVAVIIVWFALRIVLAGSFFSMISLFGLIDLAFFVLWIYMLVQTYQGKKIVLPVIGDLAAKQA